MNKIKKNLSTSLLLILTVFITINNSCKNKSHNTDKLIGYEWKLYDDNSLNDSTIVILYHYKFKNKSVVEIYLDNSDNDYPMMTGTWNVNDRDSILKIGENEFAIHVLKKDTISLYNKNGEKHFLIKYKK